MKAFIGKRLIFATVFSVSLISGFAMPLAQAETAPAKLKSIPVSPNEVMALDAAVENVEKAKTKVERDLALQKLRAQSKAFDASAARFAASLRANKEEKLFNDLLLAKAQREKGTQFLADLKAVHPSGLPSAIVAQPSITQIQLLDFEKGLPKLSKFDWWQLIGISSAEAGLWAYVKQKSCNVTMWAVTAGEGTDANYKFCGV